MNSQQNKTVYFVRHGQSTHNTLAVFQSPDSPLSEQGIVQAQKLAGRLAHVPFEALISSPFPRAHQTAQAIADKTSHEIVLSDLFVERRKPGSLVGKPYADEQAEKLYRQYIQTMYKPGGRVDDAENFDDIVSRADRALAFLLARSETNLVVVTHGWFLRVIIARVMLGDQLTGDMLKRFAELITIDNTGITVLDYRDAYEEASAWRLVTLNDRSHFAE
ncbi:MAG TPA: histidine phosphatase family protein [Candidatus Saccharimonadales bacterium]|jgi:broad specificity phosphatase PhoE